MQEPRLVIQKDTISIQIALPPPYFFLIRTPSHTSLFAPSLLYLTVVYYAISLNKSISSMIITKIVHVTVLDVELLCCHVQTRSSQTGWWRRHLLPEG